MRKGPVEGPFLGWHRFSLQGIRTSLRYTLADCTGGHHGSLYESGDGDGRPPVLASEGSEETKHLRNR
jgi:hypothetical protein